ncbi:MAG: hypothetical protein P8P74_14615 [Crocinitomicaceae bacterium]|nr:hypothetical protein [Crocinitomicaceae bacterium]
MTIFVSKLVAEQTGRWEVYQGEKLPDKVRVNIDFEDLKNRIEYDDEYYLNIETTLKKTNQIYHSVFYESLKESATQLQLLNFLDQDLPNENLTTNSVKVSKRKLEEIISNYDELTSAMKGTDLEQYLV